MAEAEVKIPLSDFVLQIAREAGYAAAQDVIKDHRQNCPAAVGFQEVSGKVQKLQVTFAMLLGLMIGSGITGGAVGGYLFKIISSTAAVSTVSNTHRA